MIIRPDRMKNETRENMRGGRGSIGICHLVDKADFSANVRLCAKLTIPPGAGIGEHRHENEDEVYVVTKGSGVLNDGRNDERVTVGDAVLTGGGNSHAIRNDGNEDLEIIAVIACC